MKKLPLVLTSLAMVAGLVAALGGCSSTIENRDPSGEPFPSVEATSLAGDTVRIPEDFAGAPVLLLVGYVQGSQFDIDRWLYGAIDADLEVALREVPAARGAAASLAKGFIDSGMQRGIPKDEWGAVTTTYGDAAEAIGRFTGTERPRNARVLLLDANGIVRWFYDQGYSALKLKGLEAALEGVTPAADVDAD
jgi:hypothetical protein